MPWLPSKGDWPVQIITDSPAWRRGFNRATQTGGKNPFDVLSQEWFGFEEGLYERLHPLQGGVESAQAGEAPGQTLGAAEEVLLPLLPPRAGG